MPIPSKSDPLDLEPGAVIDITIRLKISQPLYGRKREPIEGQRLLTAQYWSGVTGPQPNKTRYKDPCILVSQVLGWELVEPGESAAERQAIEDEAARMGGVGAVVGHPSKEERARKTVKKHKIAERLTDKAPEPMETIQGFDVFDSGTALEDEDAMAVEAQEDELRAKEAARRQADTMETLDVEIRDDEPNTPADDVFEELGLGDSDETVSE